MKTTFPVLWPLMWFPNLLAYECSTLTVSSFRIWNISAICINLLKVSIIDLNSGSFVKVGFPGGTDNKDSAFNAGDLGQEDLPEERMATHSSLLAWKIPWTEESVGLQSTEWQESEMTGRLSTHAWLKWNKVSSCLLPGMVQACRCACAPGGGCLFVQSLSPVWLFVTPWTAACQASLSPVISENLSKFISFEPWCYETISSSATLFSCL